MDTRPHITKKKQPEKDERKEGRDWVKNWNEERRREGKKEKREKRARVNPPLFVERRKKEETTGPTNGRRTGISFESTRRDHRAR